MRDFKFERLDAEMTFLHEEFEEDIYVQLLESLVVLGKG